MFSCRSDCRSLISRMAVTGNPSLSDSMRIRFNATCTPETTFLALYTLPNVPSPTWLMILYSSWCNEAEAVEVAAPSSEATCFVCEPTASSFSRLLSCSSAELRSKACLGEEMTCSRGLETSGGNPLSREFGLLFGGGRASRDVGSFSTFSGWIIPLLVGSWAGVCLGREPDSNPAGGWRSGRSSSSSSS